MAPRNFTIGNQNFHFYCDIPLDDGQAVTASMHGTQFPIVSNSATTGHKLQGYTAQSLLVNDWNYAANWAYVVLSRVTTMAGLYMNTPLSDDLKKYQKKEDMMKMLADFRRTINISEFSKEQYDAMLTEEAEDTSTSQQQH